MGRFARGMARQARERARQGSLFEEWVQMVQGLPPADQLTILHFLQGGPYRCERCADYLTAVCLGEGRAGWLAVRASLGGRGQHGRERLATRLLGRRSGGRRG